jgi:phosphate starvation-inducible PhoH-like protein
MGNNSKFIVTGDMSQIDLPKKSDSGLERGIQITTGINRVITISFQKEDIVRNPIVSHIIEAFDNLEGS